MNNPEVDKIFRIQRVQVSENEYQLQFMCPACKDRHALNDTWEFNGDYEFPSLSPSVLCQGYMFDENRNSVPFRCHTWITRGKVKFFKDCSHEMAGQQWIDLLPIT